MTEKFMKLLNEYILTNFLLQLANGLTKNKNYDEENALKIKASK